MIKAPAFQLCTLVRFPRKAATRIALARNLHSENLVESRTNRGERDESNNAARKTFSGHRANTINDSLPLGICRTSVSSPSRGSVFALTPEDSSINFFVKASVAIQGVFDKWEAALTFTTPEVETGVLNIKIQADSVNTGSGMKNGS